jgi:hypothetical protein
LILKVFLGLIQILGSQSRTRRGGAGVMMRRSGRFCKRVTVRRRLRVFMRLIHMARSSTRSPRKDDAGEIKLDLN